LFWPVWTLVGAQDTLTEAIVGDIGGMFPPPLLQPATIVRTGTAKSTPSAPGIALNCIQTIHLAHSAASSVVASSRYVCGSEPFGGRLRPRAIDASAFRLQITISGAANPDESDLSICPAADASQGRLGVQPDESSAGL
jgi:hypothetical protein